MPSRVEIQCSAIRYGGTSYLVRNVNKSYTLCITVALIFREYELFWQQIFQQKNLAARK